MPGIIGIINKKKIENVIELKKENLLHETLRYKNIYLERNTLPKFLNDKVFFETKNNIFLLEGAIFNIDELMEKYNKNNWNETLEIMSAINKDTFFNEFRGSFSGYYYDKIEKKSIIFTDHIGDKPIYFYENAGELIFTSELNSILKLLIKNNINYTLDEKGVYSLLTHGYMLEDLTPFSEIKRLKAGCRIIVNENSRYTVERYHILINTPNYNLSDEEIINKIDTLFTKSMLKQSNKNKEYGYSDVATLSAGLESRMVTWVLSQQVKDVLNITYSQSDFYDDIIPKRISAELKTHLLFKTLDNGLSLKYLDKMVQRNSGVVLYGGPAQVWDTFHLLNHNNTGIIHTGVLGGGVLGTYYKTFGKDTEYSLEDGTYSTFLIDKLKKLLDNYKIENYDNQEMFILYNRGFNGINSGIPLVLQEFTESYSPFCDIDFVEFCLTIPMEKRWGHNIYDKWILNKYPKAAKYAHNGRKITKEKSKSYKIFGKEITLKDIWGRGYNFVLRKLGLLKDKMNTSFHMNPFDYWYNTNNDLKTYMDSYFDENIINIDDSILNQDLKEMYNEGSTIDKTQVLTFLSMYKNYFTSTEWLNDE